MSIKEIDSRKERGRDETREASRSLLDVKSGFEEGPDSVISEYGLASYFTHTYTHVHTNTSHSSSRLDSTPRGLHLSALFAAMSEHADKSSPKVPCLKSAPYYQRVGPLMIT